MGKHRIYEIAKEFDVDSKKVLEFLSGHKVEVKSHMSSVDDKVHDMIVNEFGKKKNYDYRTKGSSEARGKAYDN